MTPTQQQILDGLRKGAVRRDAGRAEHETGVAEIRRLAREGREAKVPMTQLAKAAGVSRQSLYELLR